VTALRPFDKLRIPLRSVTALRLSTDGSVTGAVTNSGKILPEGPDQSRWKARNEIDGSVVQAIITLISFRFVLLIAPRLFSTFKHNLLYPEFVKARIKSTWKTRFVNRKILFWTAVICDLCFSHFSILFFHPELISQI